MTWTSLAACAGRLELFFDETRHDIALGICAQCPVINQCAATRPEVDQHAVWAGRRPSKPCTGCGEDRALIMYNRRTSAADGFESQCRACRHAAKIRAAGGIDGLRAKNRAASARYKTRQQQRKTTVNA